MRVNVRINNHAVNRINHSTLRALEKTAELLLTDITQEQLIPFDKGNLQNISTEIEKDKLSLGEIVIFHRTEYAARLYYNPTFNFQKAFNSKAQAEWWEPYLSGGKRNYAKECFETLLRRELGG